MNIAHEFEKPHLRCGKVSVGAKEDPSGSTVFTDTAEPPNLREEVSFSPKQRNSNPYALLQTLVRDEPPFIKTRLQAISTKVMHKFEENDEKKQQ